MTKPSSKTKMPWGEAWYWRLRRWMTPALRNTQYVYFEQLGRTLRSGDRWLDLGCGRRIAPVWIRDAASIEQNLIAQAREVVGVDPDPEAIADNSLPIVMHQGGAERVPESDASFDLITANMVVEHLADPQAVLAEAYRLLKPGGCLLFHTPNVYYPVTLLAALTPGALRRRITAWLEKRRSADIYPTHYRLNCLKAIQKSASRAGFEVESVIKAADSPETIRFGPLVVFELALIAVTQAKPFAGLRSNLIVTLRKPGEAGEADLDQAAETSFWKAAA